MPGMAQHAAARETGSSGIRQLGKVLGPDPADDIARIVLILG